MRAYRGIAVALVVVMMAACVISTAEAAWNGQGHLITSAIGQAGREGGGAGPRGEGKMRRGEGMTGDRMGGEGMEGGRAMGPAAQIMQRALVIAASAPWAVKDAQTQQLVDKLIADRKVLLKSEENAAAAYEQLVKVAREGNTEAIEAARNALREAGEKRRQDMQSVMEGMRALGERLREIRPQGEGGEGEFRGEGEGFRPQGDGPRKQGDGPRRDATRKQERRGGAQEF